MKTPDGIIKDLKSFSEFIMLTTERKKKIAASSTEALPEDYIAILANQLHPEKLELIIEAVTEEAAGARTFRFGLDPLSDLEHLPAFRPGQYLSFCEEVSGVSVTRPYSISSSPADAVEQGFIEVTVRRKEGGFFTEHIWRNWEVGSRVECSGPAGTFCYEPLRDPEEIICLAGGCGVTPFKSMIKDAVETKSGPRVLLLYGIRKPGDGIFKEELEQLASASEGRARVVFVCSEPEGGWSGPTGFLSADLIREQAGGVDGKALFICGPPAMYQFLEKEVEKLGLPRRRVRREVFGEVEDVTVFADFPKENAGKTFNMRIRLGEGDVFAPAAATETVLVALERAGIAPPSRCRSGECGFCDSVLLKGDLYVLPENDGRREAGKKYNHFHPCASYPMSDIDVRVSARV